MKSAHLLLTGICSVFFFSCRDNAKNSGTEGLIEQTQNNNTAGITVKANPTEELQKTLDSAMVTGYKQNTNAGMNENPFGLIDPSSVFGNEEEIIFQACAHVYVALTKNNAQVNVHEYVFATNVQATQINNALTKPLPDKTKERFLRYPLTFFPFKNRMYYLSVSEEQFRPELNDVNGMLVKFLSPEQ